MKFSDVEQEAANELDEQKKALAKEKVKASLREVQQCEATLGRLKKKHQELLERDLDSVLNDSLR